LMDGASEDVAGPKQSGPIRRGSENNSNGGPGGPPLLLPDS
jgi:hypothetical protein